MKDTIIGVVAVAIAILIAFSSCGGCSDSGGDGRTSCKNCGRKTSLVAGFGYCGSCYQGFNDWLS